MRRTMDSQMTTSGQRTHPDGLKVKSRVLVGWSPTRTLHPFWGNFRVGGDSPETPECLVPELDLILGDNARKAF
jgi:hypothetical protein